MAKLEGKVVRLTDDKGQVRIPRTLAKFVEMDDERNIQDVVETLSNELESLDNKIDNFQGIADLSNVYTKQEVDDKIAEIEIPEVDLEGLATEEFVQEQINSIEFPEVDLSGLATETFVIAKIAEAQLTNGNDVDLSAYATKDDLVGLASEEFVQEQIQAIPEVDLTNYATNEFVEEKISEIQIPSIDGLATEKYVQEQIQAIEIPEVDFIGLATEEFVEEKISEIQIPSIDGLATEEYVAEQIQAIEIPEVDLTNYATNSFVEEKISEIQIPSIDGLATETFVIAKIAEAQLENDGNNVDLSAYATKDDLVGLASEEYVAKQISEIQIPSIDGLATEEYVAEQIQAIEFPETDLSDYATKLELNDKLDIEKVNFEESVTLRYSKINDKDNVSLVLGDEDPETINLVLSEELYQIQEELETKIDSIEFPEINVDSIIEQIRNEFESQITVLNARISELEQNQVIIIPENDTLE